MMKISLLSLLVLTAFAYTHRALATEEIGVYELKQGNLSVKFTNWGATIMSVVLPDKHGESCSSLRAQVSLL